MQRYPVPSYPIMAGTLYRRSCESCTATRSGRKSGKFVENGMPPYPSVAGDEMVEKSNY